MNLVGTLKEYRGFTGTIEYNAEEKMYHGKLENIEDTVFYRARSIVELNDQFKYAVDWYLCSGLAK